MRLWMGEIYVQETVVDAEVTFWLMLPGTHQDDAIWLGTTNDLEQWVTVVISYNGIDKIVTMLDGKVDDYEWTA